MSDRNLDIANIVIMSLLTLLVINRIVWEIVHSIIEAKKEKKEKAARDEEIRNLR